MPKGMSKKPTDTIHFLNFTDRSGAFVSACGARRTKNKHEYTDEVGKETCQRCRSTAVYKEASRKVLADWNKVPPEAIPDSAVRPVSQMTAQEAKEAYLKAGLINDVVDTATELQTELTSVAAYVGNGLNLIEEGITEIRKGLEILQPN
jgi:hypothetical protein